MSLQFGILKLAEAVKHAERERDEARAEKQEIEKWLRGVCDELAAESIKRKERLEQAVALLRDARNHLCGWLNAEEVICLRVDAFLAGQPAPVKPVVDDAMVEIMCTRVHGFAWSLNLHTDDAQKVRDGMRATLVAALEEKS